MDSDDPALADWATEQYVQLGAAGRRLVRTGVFEVKVPGSDYDDGVDLGREEMEEEREEYEWVRGIFEDSVKRGDGFREVDEMFRRAAGVLNDLLEVQERREWARLEWGEESRDLSEFMGSDTEDEPPRTVTKGLEQIVEESEEYESRTNTSKGKGRAYDEAPSRSRSTSRPSSPAPPPTKSRSHTRPRSPSPEPFTPITIDTLDTLESESTTMSPTSDVPYGVGVAVSRSVTPTPISPEQSLMPRLSSPDRIELPTTISSHSATPPASIMELLDPSPPPAPVPPPREPSPVMAPLPPSRAPSVPAVQTPGSAPTPPSRTSSAPVPVPPVQQQPRSRPQSRPQTQTQPPSRSTPLRTPSPSPPQAPTPAPLSRPPIIPVQSYSSSPSLPSPPLRHFPSFPPAIFTHRQPTTLAGTPSVMSNEDVPVPSDLEGSDGGLTTPGGSPRSSVGGRLVGSGLGGGRRRRPGGSGLTTPDRSPERREMQDERPVTGDSTITGGTARTTTRGTVTPIPIPVPVPQSRGGGGGSQVTRGGGGGGGRGGKKKGGGAFRLRGGAPSEGAISEMDGEDEDADAFTGEIEPSYRRTHAHSHTHSALGLSLSGTSRSPSPVESVDESPRPPPPSPVPSPNPLPRIPTNITVIPPFTSPPPPSPFDHGEYLSPPQPLPPIQFWLPTYPSYDSFPRSHPPHSHHNHNHSSTAPSSRSTNSIKDPLGAAPPPVFLALGARRACIPYTPAFQGLDLRVVRGMGAREKLVIRDAMEVLGRLGAKVKRAGVAEGEGDGGAGRTGEMWSLSYVGW